VSVQPRTWRCAAVGMMAAVLVLTAACGIPTSGGPTAIAKADVPFDLLSPAGPSTATPTVPPAVTVPELIFLVAPTQTLVPVSRNIQLPANLTLILDALFEGPTSAESQSGYQTFLTGSKIRVSAKIVGGVATVNFNDDPVQVGGAYQTLAIAQVVFTATEQPGVTGVMFQIAGQPTDVPTASGAEVPGPVDRSSYGPQAPF
jgi:spore germination protein GerM